MLNGCCSRLFQLQSFTVAETPPQESFSVAEGSGIASFDTFVAAAIAIAIATTAAGLDSVCSEGSARSIGSFGFAGGCYSRYQHWTHDCFGVAGRCSIAQDWMACCDHGCIASCCFATIAAAIAAIAAIAEQG